MSSEILLVPHTVNGFGAIEHRLCTTVLAMLYGLVKRFDNMTSNTHRCQSILTMQSVARLRSASSSRGISVIEVVVAMAIIGLLMAIALPAIQSARQAARKTQCLSNVRQISLAMTNYANTHQSFPPSGVMNGASFLVRLLPYLEQDALYSRFDFNRSMREQVPLAFRRPAVFACPTDLVVGAIRFRSNYSGNSGWYQESTPGSARWGNSFLVGPIPFITEPALSFEQIPDGLSSTVAISEVLPSGGSDVKRAVWKEKPSTPIFRRPVEVMGNECLAATTFTFAWPRASMWTLPGFGETIYDHVLSPNTRSCLWVFNAGSSHSSGVHSGLCDGSARFISAHIDTVVWRSIGTRNGGETVALP